MPRTVLKPCVLSCPSCGALSGTDAFSGAEDFRQGQRLSCRPHALILMGDWCGLSDTTETKTRVRRHHRT